MSRRQAHAGEPQRHCLSCGYPLDYLESASCPECGRDFDLSDSRTWAPHRRAREAGALRKQFSVVVLLVLANYGAFATGMCLDRWGGWADMLGAHLCQSACVFGNVLLIAAPLYSAIRRYVLPFRAWDFYGPALAVIGNLVMHMLVRCQPLWLPPWPWW